MLQFAQFIAAGYDGTVCKIAGGNALDYIQRVPQRTVDLLGDDGCRKCAQYQCQQRAGDLQSACLTGVLFASIELEVVHGVTCLSDRAPLFKGFFRGFQDIRVCCCEALHRRAVADQRSL